MKIYSFDELNRYATNLKLSETVIQYIVTRINNFRPINALNLCYEIRERLSEEYFYYTYSTGRPKAYKDICMLFRRLVEDNKGYFVKYNVSEVIYVGDIYF